MIHSLLIESCVCVCVCVERGPVACVCARVCMWGRGGCYDARNWVVIGYHFLVIPGLAVWFELLLFILRSLFLAI